MSTRAWYSVTLVLLIVAAVFVILAVAAR